MRAMKTIAGFATALALTGLLAAPANAAWHGHGHFGGGHSPAAMASTTIMAGAALVTTRRAITAVTAMATPPTATTITTRARPLRCRPSVRSQA